MFAGCDAAFAFESFREVAQVAETGVDGYVVNTEIGVFQFSLFAIFGSFLCCFNSLAALAADEIRVQKKRTVSDAPGLCSVVLLFMDFSLFLFTSKPYSEFIGKGCERMS